MGTGTVSLASVHHRAWASNEDSNRPDLNDDASVIVYNSRASNLVPGDTNGQSDCFLTRRANLNVVQRVSLGNHGQQLDGFTYRCKVDRTATKMVFDSQSTNGFDTPMSGNYQVYLRNLVSGELTLVSRRTDGTHQAPPCARTSPRAEAASPSRARTGSWCRVRLIPTPTPTSFCMTSDQQRLG